jgi:S1-C subfamily serine protease
MSIIAIQRASRIAAAIAVALAVSPLTALAAETKSEAQVEKDIAQSEKAIAEREQKLEAARKRLSEAAREVAELNMQISQEAMPRVARIFSGQASRAMLGVNIGGAAERKDGVEVVSVSPGGPAAEAGLKAGDVIVELKGKSLKQSGNDSPREKLLEIMRSAEPGEKIALRYVRDGKTTAATVAARPVGNFFTMPAMTARVGGGTPNFAFFRADGVFGSAELVPLTPKLGQYFGTDKGLLVVRAPDSRFQLEDGDVIVDIDGRVPTNASHAFRILGSYQAGEKVKLNVLRMKKRVQVDVTIPEDERWEQRFERQHFIAPPVPADVMMPAPAVLPAPAVRVLPGVGVPVEPPPAPAPRDDTA